MCTGGVKSPSIEEHVPMESEFESETESEIESEVPTDDDALDDHNQPPLENDDDGCVPNCRKIVLERGEYYLWYSGDGPIRVFRFKHFDKDGNIIVRFSKDASSYVISCCDIIGYSTKYEFLMDKRQKWD